MDRNRIAEYEREIQLIKRQMRDRSPCISRQQSWSGLLQPPPEASPSSDSEVDTVQEKERERQLMLLKRFERRNNGSNTSLNARESSERRSQFRARARSPLAFSQSIDVASSGSKPREYQRCSSSRSLSTAIYMDDTISSSSSDSIPSSLNEDEPITIRSAHSCNTINMSTSNFSCSPAASGSSSTRQLTKQLSQQSEHKIKKQSKGIKERILLKMRTHSHSLPASPQMTEDHEIEEHPATAAPSLTLLSHNPLTKSNCSVYQPSSNKDDIR